MKTWGAFRLYAAQEFAEIFAKQTYGDASGCKRAKREGDSGADVDAFHCLASEWMRA